MQMKWLAILTLFCASSVEAQASTETPDFRSLSDAELGQQVAAIQTEGFRDPCSRKVPLFNELDRRNPGHAGVDAGRLTAEAFCAYEEERDAEGLEFLKQAERAFPQGPSFPGLGLYFAGRLEDGAEALARLRRIAKLDQLRLLPVDTIFGAMRTVRADRMYDELEEFAYELTATAGFQQLDPELKSAFAAAAIRHGAGIGDLSRIDDLLQYDANPSSYQTMLSDRSYEPAWPLIEERAGDNLGKVAEEYVRETAGRLAEAPEDRDRLSRYAHALYYAGRFQEAVDVVRNWWPDRDNLDSLEEGDAWALNIEAYALDALGRREEADVVFDQLATLPADELYWVVNFVINRASRLVGQERWEEGLVAEDLARTVAAEHGSTYAQMLVARSRACALQQLGRREEIARETDFLVEHFNDAPAAATTGLMCVGREADARRLIASALADERARNALIDAMQDERFELFYTPSALPEARDLILADNALREEILRHVRLLPERFVPISYLRRSELVTPAP